MLRTDLAKQYSDHMAGCSKVTKEMLVAADKGFGEMLKERGLPGHLRYEMYLNVWGQMLKEWRSEIGKIQAEYSKGCENVLKAGLDKYERSRWGSKRTLSP
eukprot:6654368-Pyramimonas_sp.AAC.1